MPNLLENNLLLQFLSGAGASIGGEGSFAAGVNPMVQQNIAAQSQAATQKGYMKMLAKLLGKGVDFTSDKEGKISVKGEDMKSISSLLGGTSLESKGMAESIYPTSLDPIERGTLNPSSSPLGDISTSDLAGLTPQDVSRALTGAISVAGLPSEIASRQGLIDYYRSTTDIASKRADTAAYLARTKDTRTTTQKEYAQGRLEGFKGNLQEWKEGTVREKRLYDEYVASSVIAKGDVKPFHEWIMIWRKAGGLQISVGQRAEETALGKDIGDLKSPDLRKSVYNYLDELDENFWKLPEQEKSLGILKEIDRRIRATPKYSGKVIERKKDGWYVDGVREVSNPFL